MNDFVNQHTHEGGLETEVQAAIRASYRADSIKSQILNELENCGDNGLTPDEFNKATNGLINTTRRRFTDLWKEGHIKHHPNNLTRTNDKGNECTVWVLGRDINTKTRFELLNDEINRLKDILISNNINPDTGRRNRNVDIENMDMAQVFFDL